MSTRISSPGRIGSSPFPSWRRGCRSSTRRGSPSDAIVGDLLRGVPPAERPPPESLAPPGAAILFGREKAEEAERREAFEGKSQFQVANAEARLAWMDEQGIDLQNVICLSGIAYGTAIHDPALRREVIEAANTWLGETCAGGQGRLLPVTCLDYADLGAAVAELERMRRYGSRVFLVPAYPVEGVPPVHPDWDRVWAAAVDLGMTPMLHTGFERMTFDPGWANLGTDTTVMRMLCSAHRHVAPTTLVNAMVYSGVFERFPKLTLQLAEVGTGWLPFLLGEIDDRVSPVSELFLGSRGFRASRANTSPNTFGRRRSRAATTSPFSRSSSDCPKACWSSPRTSRTSRASRIRWGTTGPSSRARRRPSSIVFWVDRSRRSMRGWGTRWWQRRRRRSDGRPARSGPGSGPFRRQG